MISKRVQGFTESVIREMTRVSAEHGGVNLAQGFPNFPPPRVLVEAAHRALDGDFHQYAITWGARNLREAIAAKFERFYGARVDPERQVTVCCGSTEAMLSTLLAVLDPGDEIVIFEPFYENYGPGAIISGAKPVFVPLEPPDFSFDPDRLARAFTPRTRAIVFNSPNNPTGKVFSLRELEIIAELCQRHDVLAITDEIYEHMVYDGLRHIPIATLPGMADRTITISGVSKSYSVTGWRIGYTISSPELAVGIRRAHDFVTVGAPAPAPGGGRHGAPAAGLVLRRAPRGLPGAAGSPARPARQGGVPDVRRPGRLLHPHRVRPLPRAVRSAGRHGVRHVPHQGGRRGDRAGLVLLRAPGARAHEDPLLLPQDGRRAPRRGPAAPAPSSRPVARLLSGPPLGRPARGPGRG